MSEQVAFQREFYDRHFAKRESAMRDQLAHPLFRSFNDRVAGFAFEVSGVAARVGAGQRARVLEVGCGEGLVAASVRRVAGELGLELAYTGADVSEAALALARTHLEGELLCGNAVELLSAMPDRSQDLILAKNLLHHLDDPASFLREAGRVAGPDGRVVVFEPNLGCPQFLVFNVLAFRREKYYFEGRRRNLRALAAAGVDVLRTERFSWLPYELAFVIRYPWFRRVFSTDSPSTIEAVSRLDDRLARWLRPTACYTVWVAAGRS